ncbi:MAG: peptidoglycan DD-metalloendopeptidase family protein [Rhodobacteraceae bacterium]|nr:peptidoglycan DD-metalloendopeptidase family protein [Paracoccaceae bacterium]
MRLIPLVLGTMLAAPVAASDFRLEQPIDCTLGTDCFIQQLVDLAPGPEVLDFRCGSLSYDGHKGTDFALPYLSDMEEGVNVLAAAEGTVLATRNTMPDMLYSAENAAQVEGTECGNGVVIGHEGGWQTQYCHLKQGSLAVTKGDRVTTGTVLGQVGLSGQTQFPHLHLSVRYKGDVIDPFSPTNAPHCSAPPETSLWAALPLHSPGGLIGAGFHDAIPDYSDIKAGTADLSPLQAKAGALVFWAFAYGGLQGDVLRLHIDGPDGAFISQDIVLERDQAQFFRATGRRLTTERWPAGRYAGTATLIRGNSTLGKSTHVMTVSD